MVHAKAVAGKVLAFVLAVVLVALVPGVESRAAANLDGEPYQGLLQLIGPNPIVYCKFSSYKAEIGEGYGISSFEGSDPSIISFSQQKGYRYNGYVQLDVTYRLLSNVGSVLNLEQIGASMIYQTSIDGIHVSVRMLDRQYDYVKLSVNVFFNDYVATFDGDMHIPFTVRLETSATSNRTEPNILGRGLYFSRDVSVDWHGFFRQFPFGGDAVSPGTGGTLIDQNDDIIANTDKGNQLQEEANALQQEANETSKGILGKITEFFGGFFKNLGDTVLSWIVPTSDQLSAFLEEVNAWFGDRLGFIWYPFDLALRLVDALAKGDADTSFQIPPLELQLLGEKHVIYPGSTVDMDAFGFFKYVRMFTSFLLVSGVVKMAVKKWDEWIGGHTG